jgi:SulP family sulfate permease
LRGSRQRSERQTAQRWTTGSQTCSGTCTRCSLSKPHDVPAYVFSPHIRESLGHNVGKYVLKQLKTSFPPVLWLPTYQLDRLPLDLVAGLTVGVLAVSQGLAYAALGGLPPYYGLYSFVVPVFTYALLSSSRRVSFGPTTIVMILTLQTLSPLANPDTQPQQYLVLAFELAMLNGLWTTLLGVLRLGFLVDLLGAPVLSGFITAAGLVIASTQLRSFFGTNAPRTTDFIPSVIEWAGLARCRLPTGLRLCSRRRAFWCWLQFTLSTTNCRSIFVEIAIRCRGPLL